MKQISWALQTAAFYLFTWMMALIPESVRLSAGRSVGLLMMLVLVKRRKIAIDNIRQALPFMTRHAAWMNDFTTAEEIARETFIHLGQSLVETCRLYHGKGAAIIDTIEIRGREHYEQARAKNKGILFVNGHCGNWELLPFCFKRLFGESMSVIARRQNNPYMNSIVEKMRMNSDNIVIYKQGALRQIMAALKKQGIIGILADQAVSQDDGFLIDVLGRKAWASKAPIIIARKTGVPVIPVSMYRDGNRHIVIMSPEFELSGVSTEDGIKSDVQALSRYLENFICAHPADWYWVHRRWKRAGEPSDVS